MSESVDVVVIGSGAGAAPVAYACAKAGASVLVLERGKRIRREEVNYDELSVSRHDIFIPPPETDPHLLFADGKPPERSREGWIAVVVGGGTAHMSGFFYRFRPEDFRLADHLGEVPGANVENWPITYEELEPYYARVERDIGVSGSADEGPFVSARSGPYPLPPTPTHPFGELIDAAAKKVGVRSFITPRAVLSQPVGGRGACHYHPMCGSFACHSGAKSSMFETYLPMAEATGKCRILPESRVHLIEADEQGRAKRVVYRDASGVDHAVEARVVVVACSAVESVRLLLLSQSGKHPHGLGNSDGQLGKNLLFSTLSKAHASYPVGKDSPLASRFGFLGRSVADYYLATDKKRGVRKAGGLNFLLPAGGPVFQSQLLALDGENLVWGKKLSSRLKSYWLEQRQVDCETFGEFLANPDTGVGLDPSVKDAAGFPVARIYVKQHPHDVEVSKLLAERAAAIFDATGAKQVWQSNLGRYTGHLPMGGCRMGLNPQKSVVDKHCRSHSVPNLFVSDASVFPSSGGWPPTLTILANALRVGDHIAAALKSREL